ncbi:o-succinylbenzoate synthase [Amycolatopsis sp. CA-230715]|uniref:o-succinylbenzoate synthase n=1 Tax=Amycolatopsis sp. CA-230715 TaxID=2745196 RepID=UPI001C00EC50|nr:o-succinylbenzoate synthase [Amycolatopsis sp. CA-230715]QWF83527.1 o-succinylbenzoate synthase [Amycolatopsis sp. CA-230715]
MRLAEVELRRIRLPLLAPFRTSFGAEFDRDILLIGVVTEDGVRGWGECVAGHSPLYSSEHVAGAHQVIQDVLLPRLWPLPDVRAHRAEAALAPVQGHRMAKAAIEMALLDAELRTVGVPLAEHLGAVREAVPAGVSVGIADSLPELLDSVAGFLDAGYRRIKLKIEPGWDVTAVRAVRERFGDIGLQVDANAAYSLADANHLAELDQFGLSLIEQPLAEDDLRGHAALARRLRTPICLDESITSARAAADAVALGACQIVNIKSGRVGGLLEARRVHDVCAANGLPVWCGGMLETGIGRAANVALAALPNFRLPGDTSASDRYWRRDVVTEPFVLRDGSVRVPEGPGLGVEVDEAWLAELTTSVDRVRPPEQG